MRFPEKPRVGLVASKARGWTSHAGAKLLRRGSATFVAVLCENEAVQKCLPSFVLCNKHLCPKKLYEDLLAAAPPSLCIWRLASSWNTSVVMCEILEVLAAALRPWQQFCQPTLTMDLAPCHITQSVLQKARSLQLFIACVPTGLTPQLQVADVFCFRAFKAFFAGEIQKLRAEGHEVTKALFFQIFFKVPAWLQARSWAKAFQAICALDGNINLLTKDLQALGLDPTVQDSLPTQSQIASLWPRQRCTSKTYSLLFTRNLE